MIFIFYDNFFEPSNNFFEITEDYFYSKILFFYFQIYNVNVLNKIKYRILYVLYSKKHEILLIKFKIDYDLVFLQKINNYTKIIFKENIVNNINNNLNYCKKFK